MSGAARTQGLDVAAAAILGDSRASTSRSAPAPPIAPGSAAAIFVELERRGGARVVADAVRESGVDVLVHSATGRTCLIAERGFPGIVVALGPAFDWIRVEASTITAGGGVALPVLARRAQRRGTALARLGGRDSRVRRRGRRDERRWPRFRHGLGAHRVRAWRTLSTGEIGDLAATSWTSPIATRRFGPTDVVLEATFAAPGDAAAAASSIDEIVRWRRSNQPGGRNAGSVFQNPEGDSAGRIIDELGLKGFRIGGASISEKHANFIQLDVGGSSDDVKALIEAVIGIVEERTRHPTASRGPPDRLCLMARSAQDSPVASGEARRRRSSTGRECGRGVAAQARMHPRLARRRAAVGREAGRRRLVVLLGALSVLSVAVIAYAALHSSLFSARHVTIVGNQATTDQQILDASGMLAHPALLNIDVARDEAAIEQLPWIDSGAAVGSGRTRC